MAQVKEATGTSFRINTICDFKTFKKAVELNRLSLKFVLLCHEDIHESFHKDNANFDSLSQGTLGESKVLEKAFSGFSKSPQSKILRPV